MFTPLQREIDKKYALRFIAVLALAAVCCAGLVRSVIWIVDELAMSGRLEHAARRWVRVRRLTQT